jgi:uncharacterized protein (TIGR00369 family)
MSCSPPLGFHPFRLKGFFYDTIGPLYARYAGGRLSLGFRCDERRCNVRGICHGGMLMTLADLQIGIGSNIDAGYEGFGPTVNLAGDFVRPVRIGEWVQSRSELVRRTRRLVFMAAWVEADGELALRANGIVNLPREPGGFAAADFLPPEHRE